MAKSKKTVRFFMNRDPQVLESQAVDIRLSEAQVKCLATQFLSYLERQGEDLRWLKVFTKTKKK